MGERADCGTLKGGESGAGLVVLVAVLAAAATRYVMYVIWHGMKWLIDAVRLINYLLVVH